MLSQKDNASGLTLEFQEQMEDYRKNSVPIPFVLPDIFSGAINIWSGTIVSIPTGWVLCDGNNGTPDLRNKFVVGAGDTYAVNDSGGSNDHNHDYTGDFHSHTISPGLGISPGADFETSAISDLSQGDTDNADNFPPFFSLAYIMKL